jgi:hypothetical protein
MQQDQNNEPNILSGFDNLVTRLNTQIEKFATDLSPKIEEIKILVRKEKERAIKDSTTSHQKGSVSNKRLNIPSWKLRTMMNLNWMTEERALLSISHYKSSMLDNLDIEPTAIQEKHFSILQPTAKTYFEELCAILEGCNDAISDYLMETRRTQPTSVIIYDEAVATTIQLLEKMQSGITIAEFSDVANTIITLAKRIKAKLLEKRDYLTDRLAWRGIGIKSFNL